MLSLFSFLFIFDSFKTIKNLEKREGILIEKAVLKERFKGNNYRYTFEFKLDNYNQGIGIFLGSGDEAINDGKYYQNLLQIGQPIVVYLDNNFITENEGISRLIYRLDYNGKTILRKNNRNLLKIGLVGLSFNFIFIGLLILLKRRYEKEKLTLINRNMSGAECPA